MERDRFRLAALVAPALVIFAAVFVAPFLYFFVISFWRVSNYRLTADVSLANYAKAASGYLGVAVNTFLIAIAVSLAGIVLGMVFAAIIRFKAGRWGVALLYVPLMTLFGGYLMKIYSWKTILGNEGIINSTLMQLGWIDGPVEWLLYSPLAVGLTLTYFVLPFAVLPIYSSMRGIEEIELQAARDLGAGWWRRLNDIVIPQCRSGILAAFVVGFLLTVGDYVTPILVGGKVTMIGNLIAPQFGQYFNWPLGAAMSFVVLAISVVFIAVFWRGLNLWRPR